MDLPTIAPRESSQDSTKRDNFQQDRMDAVWDVVAAMMPQPTFDAAALTLCLRLGELASATRVSLGEVDGSRIRLVASTPDGIDELDATTSEAIVEAMHESRDQRSVVVVPPLDPHPIRIDAGARRLRQRLHGRVVSLPIAWQAGVAAVIVLEIEPGRLPDLRAAATLAAVENAAALAGPYLLALQRAERGEWARWRERWTRLRTARPGRVRRATIGIALGVAAVLALGACWPLPMTIGAPARVEGAVQRVIAAPVDGFVKRFFVRPGDPVTEGQIVAELIDRDLQLERSRTQGEITQHENAYAAAMARADRAALVIAQAKLAESRAQAALIDQQLARIQMRAPIDGAIVLGDLSQMVGAPVEKGQVLMTAAPIGQYRVIVELDERDIGWARTGQQGRLSVSAMPWSWIDVEVQRITPMTQLVDGRNVFELEARPLGDVHGLRAGLRGVVRLDVGRAPWLSVWPRRLLDHLHRFVWRWVP